MSLLSLQPQGRCHIFSLTPRISQRQAGVRTERHIPVKERCTSSRAADETDSRRVKSVVWLGSLFTHQEFIHAFVLSHQVRQTYSDGTDTRAATKINYHIIN